MRAALVASCLRGALPPVDLRAVCLVRAIVRAAWRSGSQQARFFNRRRQAARGKGEPAALTCPAAGGRRGVVQRASRAPRRRVFGLRPARVARSGSAKSAAQALLVERPVCAAAVASSRGVCLKRRRNAPARRTVAVGRRKSAQQPACSGGKRTLFDWVSITPRKDDSCPFARSCCRTLRTAYWLHRCYTRRFAEKEGSEPKLTLEGTAKLKHSALQNKMSDMKARAYQ